MDGYFATARGLRLKKIFAVPNTLAYVQILLSVAATVAFVLCKSFNVYIILAIEAAAVIGIVLLRFAKRIVEFFNEKLFVNKVYGYKPFKVDIEEYSEKLGVGAFFIKLFAYLAMSIQVVFLFVVL